MYNNRLNYKVLAKTANRIYTQNSIRRTYSTLIYSISTDQCNIRDKPDKLACYPSTLVSLSKEELLGLSREGLESRVSQTYSHAHSIRALTSWNPSMGGPGLDMPWGGGGGLKTQQQQSYVARCSVIPLFAWKVGGLVITPVWGLEL